MTRTAFLVVVGFSLLSSGCGGATDPPDAEPRIGPVAEVREGLASYYSQWFHGRRTASGTTFDNDAMLAAHPTFPFGTIVRVTNLGNGKTVRVRVVDRGPAKRERERGVIIDLSRAAASQLGFIDAGRTRVRIERAG